MKREAFYDIAMCGDKIWFKLTIISHIIEIKANKNLPQNSGESGYLTDWFEEAS